MNIKPSILVRAAKIYGLEISRLKPLGGMEGMALAFDRDKEKYVLKITPKKQDTSSLKTEIEAKSDFIAYLADNGVSVAQPVRSPDGKWLEIIRTNEMYYYITSAKRVDGKHLDLNNPRQSNPEIFEAWGKTTGQMHRLAKSYPFWKKFSEFGEILSPISDWKDEFNHFLNWTQEDEIREKWINLSQEIKELPISRDSYGLIHNDLHPKNFLVDKDNSIAVIDFDVCSFHFYIKDIAIALFFTNWIGNPGKGTSKDDYLTTFLQNYIRGYGSENELDYSWYRQLPTFLKHHQILLYIVFSNEWKSPNPWQSATLQKWKRQILSDAPVLKVLI